MIQKENDQPRKNSYGEAFKRAKISGRVRIGISKAGFAKNTCQGGGCCTYALKMAGFMREWTHL